jgi:hypothetical protein
MIYRRVVKCDVFKFCRCQKHNVRPTNAHYIYHKNEKGKPPKNELLVLTLN